MQYQAGDYFGELALLKNEPRAASIIARTDLKLATIDRESFKRLLGPLDKILMRNI
jgi:cAMP-dependent protein kinase regulator